MRIARSKGARVFAITNCVGSRITRESDGTLYVKANMEISVAATKSFLAQISCLALIAMFLGQKKGRLTTRQVKSLYYELRETPSQIEDILQDTSVIEEAAKEVAKAHSVMYVGRGIGSPICNEGALKLKEISYLHAEAYPAGELKHGPIALLDENVPVVAVVTESPTRMQTLSNVQEILARGSRVVAVATEGDQEVADIADYVFYIPPIADWCTAITAIVRALHRHRARMRCRQAAQPREVGDRGMTGAATESPMTGLGVDIVEIDRMDRILQRSPRFAYRVFSDDERAYCEGHHRPAVRYATHFAAKEAVLKALGTGFADGIAFTDVEVTHDEKGKPIALLHGRAKRIAESLGILEIPLSLSRTNETAVANAIAVTAATRPVVEEKVTPAQELAMRFRELRSMLDDLEQDIEQADEEPEDIDA